MKKSSIFLIIILIAISLLVILLFITLYKVGIIKFEKNNKDFYDLRINDISLPENERSYYYVSSDEFKSINDYENYYVENIYSFGGVKLQGLKYNGRYTNEGILINSEKEFDEFKEINNKDILFYEIDSINVDWNKNSLIIYYYYNLNNYKLTSITGIKVTDIMYADDYINIYLAVSEGHEKKVDNPINSEAVYIITDKIKENTKLNFTFNKYDAILEYCKKDIEIPD